MRGSHVVRLVVALAALSLPSVGVLTGYPLSLERGPAGQVLADGPNEMWSHPASAQVNDGPLEMW